ncbi:uncharacterized protein LOC126973503 isoform X2 [Leptidea sinapis]|uniref:uncharacterized protein LOC126973503 isoform X2 n=1 Tax=Leptidea sinapis TaxID=189913 RepID=UPI0021C2CD40|nr:uncharacterized protein LOC126973503 isoform X2 [Leptidea sinapis]
MRLICFWCLLVTAVRGQDDEYYAPQTFNQQMNEDMFQPVHLPWNSALRKADEAGPHYREMFTPPKDVDAAGSVSPSWRPGNEAPVYEDYRDQGYKGPPEVKPEPWRQPFPTKQQQASILHHKQSLTSEGAFRFEYASDNGLAAGEVIEPDGSRVGAYQYKDPSGQLVKLKYRAGKGGFQILEGSHVPKSPEPSPPQNQDSYNNNVYEQQRQQYETQQQYNQQRTEPAQAPQNQATGGQYYLQNWKPDGQNDGQYRENDVEENKGPHSFGEGYSFSFQGKNN